MIKTKEKIQSEKYKNQKITYYKLTYSDNSFSYRIKIEDTEISTVALYSLEKAQKSAKIHIDNWENDINSGWFSFKELN